MNNTTKLLLALGAALVLATAVFLFTQKSPTLAPTINVTEVNEAEDLDTVEGELDEENLDAIDSELEAIDEDSYSF